MTNAESSKLEGLELLRFLLSFSVLVFHYCFFGPMVGLIVGTMPGPSAFQYLRFGVEVFFVISGFVICKSALHRTAWSFAIARYLRLAPVLLICSTLTYLIIKLVGAAPTPSVTFRAYLSSILVLPMIRGPILDWSLWSLQYEIKFYILIGLLMLLPKWQSKLPIFVAVLTVMGLVQLILLVTLGRSPILLASYSTWFAIGMCMVPSTGTHRTRMVLLTANTLLAVLFLNHELREYASVVHLPSPNRLTGVLLTIAIVSLFLIFLKLNISSAAIRLMGRVSYPLYAIHQLLGYCLLNLLMPRIGYYLSLVAVTSMMLVISLAIALYGEPWVENFYRLVGRSVKRMFDAIYKGFLIC
jgi:peptidoglycan/LPS O-acetylase OafA/YrhL